MARGWAARCLLTGLHVIAALAACGTLVTVYMQWAEGLVCLAPITDHFGDPGVGNHVLKETCDVITYSNGAIFALCFLLALTLNCTWGNLGCSVVQQAVTVLMLAVSVGSGAALTMHCMMWCQALQTSVGQFDGCERAAERYDKLHKVSNMTAYFRNMEMHQVCQWAVVPSLLCAVVVYSVVMKSTVSGEAVGGREEPCRLGQYILVREETAPLITAARDTQPTSYSCHHGPCQPDGGNLVGGTVPTPLPSTNHSTGDVIARDPRL